MHDFLVHNALYIVLSIVLICWIGIFMYLLRLDKKISYLEQQMRQ